MQLLSWFLLYTLFLVKIIFFLWCIDFATTANFVGGRNSVKLHWCGFFSVSIKAISKLLNLASFAELALVSPLCADEWSGIKI